MLQVRDNGVCFLSDPAISGFGIRSMQGCCAKVRAKFSSGDEAASLQGSVTGDAGVGTNSETKAKIYNRRWSCLWRLRFILTGSAFCIST